MSHEILCCVCLETNCDDLTDCCKNKIHRNCLINWLIYKGTFNCPLCRSTNIRIPIQDLLTSQVSNYGLTQQEISNNLNKLIKEYNIPYNIVINIPEERVVNRCLPPCVYFRYRVRLNYLKHCLYLLCIPLFYIILFYLMSNYYIPSKINTLDYD